MKALFKKLFVRLQNRNVLLALVSGVLLILANLGVVKVEQVDHVNQVVNVVLGALVALGVVSDPESHVKG